MILALPLQRVVGEKVSMTTSPPLKSEDDIGEEDRGDMKRRIVLKKRSHVNVGIHKISTNIGVGERKKPKEKSIKPRKMKSKLSS